MFYKYELLKILNRWGDCLLKIIFSVTSAFLFLLTSSSFIEMPFRLEEKIFNLIAGISIYLPFGLGILGLLFAVFGVKGYVRLTLSVLNIAGLVFYLFIFIMATVGFQEP